MLLENSLFDNKELIMQNFRAHSILPDNEQRLESRPSSMSGVAMHCAVRGQFWQDLRKLRPFIDLVSRVCICLKGDRFPFSMVPMAFCMMYDAAGSFQLSPAFFADVPTSLITRYDTVASDAQALAVVPDSMIPTDV